MSDPRESEASVDPYRAPRAAVRPVPEAAPPRLFAPSSVALASALGTALAGGVLIALNYVAMRRYSAALAAGLIVGPTLFGVAALVAAQAASADFPSWLRIAMALAFQSVSATAAADMLQRRHVRARLREGQAPASRWLALIVALVSLPLTAAIALPIAAIVMR